MERVYADPCKEKQTNSKSAMVRTKILMRFVYLPNFFVPLHYLKVARYNKRYRQLFHLCMSHILLCLEQISLELLHNPVNHKPSVNYAIRKNATSTLKHSARQKMNLFLEITCHKLATEVHPFGEIEKKRSTVINRKISIRNQLRFLQHFITFNVTVP